MKADDRKTGASEEVFGEKKTRKAMCDFFI